MCTGTDGRRCGTGAGRCGACRGGCAWSAFLRIAGEDVSRCARHDLQDRARPVILLTNAFTKPGVAERF